MQRNFHTTVKRDVKGTLIAETFYHEKGRQVIARLIINDKSFEILQAFLEEFPQVDNESVRVLDSLKGIKAYLGSGLSLRKAVDEHGDPLVLELFAETIRGVIQAETFLLKERGYESPTEYSGYWEKMYKGTCRYYSNLERVQQSWDNYSEVGYRDGYLFTRTKNYFLYEEAPDYYLICGGLSDTFHEMNITLKVKNGFIKAAEGIMLRVPDVVCGEATMLLNNIIDMKVNKCSKKQLADLLGKGQGCVHLVDVVFDSINTLAQYIKPND
ncbi:DUF2889 domain-containing protein [Dethiobacter alkaliphilus]|uniref:DUF2889 domain-containing protein n=1 Tax=Dethiobacter alkaliphilus TaxID=427926 RepID=UPI0013755FFF|nr:DUF2889 domain-containing protein [Dethiobacter alkaliphilus]